MLRLFSLAFFLFLLSSVILAVSATTIPTIATPTFVINDWVEQQQFVYVNVETGGFSTSTSHFTQAVNNINEGKNDYNKLTETLKKELKFQPYENTGITRYGEPPTQLQGYKKIKPSPGPFTITDEDVTECTKKGFKTCQFYAQKNPFGNEFYIKKYAKPLIYCHDAQQKCEKATTTAEAATTGKQLSDERMNEISAICKNKWKCTITSNAKLTPTPTPTPSPMPTTEKLVFDSINREKTIQLIGATPGKVRAVKTDGPALTLSVYGDENAKCITPTVQGNDVKLEYNPLCKTCGKNFEYYAIKNGKQVVWPIEIKCQADVLLWTRGKALATNHELFSTMREYSNALANEPVERGKLSIRYVEIDDEETAEALNYKTPGVGPVMRWWG